MKIIHWNFRNLTVPMLRINGVLYTTNYILSTALGVGATDLYHIRLSRPDEFRPLRMSNLHPKVRTELEQHKALFGIERLRTDMLLWSEEDMLSFGFAAKSKYGREFRAEVIQLIKEQVRLGAPTAEEHAQLLDKYTKMAEEVKVTKYRIDTLEDTLSPFMNAVASGAGKTLRTFRGGN